MKKKIKEEKEISYIEDDVLTCLFKLKFFQIKFNMKDRSRSEYINEIQIGITF